MSVPPKVRALASAVHTAAANLNAALDAASKVGYKLDVYIESRDDLPYKYIYTTALKEDHFSYLEKRPWVPDCDAANYQNVLVRSLSELRIECNIADGMLCAAFMWDPMPITFAPNERLVIEAEGLEIIVKREKAP